MRKNGKRTAAIAATIIAGAGVSGIAIAYWTGNGSGSGSATAASSAQSLSLTSGSVTGLTPGNSQTVNVTAHNSSNTSVAVSHLSLSSFTSGVTGCDSLASGAAATASATDPSSQVVVPANGTATVGTVTVSLPDSTTVNQDACKGVTWTFSLSAS